MIKNKSSGELAFAKSAENHSVTKGKSASLSSINKFLGSSDLLLKGDSAKKSSTPTKKEKKVTLKSIENLTNNVVSAAASPGTGQLNNSNKLKALSSEILSVKSTETTSSTSESKYFSYSYIVLAASFVSYMLVSRTSP